MRTIFISGLLLAGSAGAVSIGATTTAPGSGKVIIAVQPADATTSAKTASVAPKTTAQAVTAQPNYVYPDQATISLTQTNYSQTAKEVHVVISLDRPTPNTVVAKIATQNDSLDTNYYTPVDTFITFRPGDPLTQTVRIPITKFKAAGTFWLTMPDAQGAKLGKTWTRITAVANAPATYAVAAGRAAKTYVPSGSLKYNMNMATTKWSPTGGKGTWSTQLNHGRSQLQNGETGLYLDEQLWPAAEKPIKVSGGRLFLHTSKLATPIEYAGGNWGYGAGTFNYGAVVLSGKTLPETQVTRGSYEWTAQMPSRIGSWPALWLVGVNGWPPEIDVFEGMSHLQGWDMARTTYNAIHGGPVNTQTFAPGARQPTARYGVADITNSFHTYAVTIDKQYITFFLDGKETWQVINMFDGQGAFFPLMSIGVTSKGAYTGGTPDMVLSAFKVYEAL